MTPSARIETIIAALGTIAETPAPADTVLAKFFRARRFIGSKDRAHIAGVVYRIQRCEARLEWWLHQIGLEEGARSIALADAMLNDGLPLADLHKLCDGSKYAPAEISKAEHEALKQLSGKSLEDEAMPAWARLECPPEAEPMLRDAFGDKFESVMRAMQEAAPLDVRVNTLMSEKAKMLREFREVKFDVSEGRWSPNALRLQGRPNLNNHPAFRTGGVEVQDEGSQLLAMLVDARPGMRVMDFCAGAGGKTLALAAHMQNKGRIMATDISESRLRRAGLRFRRANVQNAETHVIENENDAWLKRHKDGFDRVLVDAPCSGTGTWRRNPDMRWKQHSLGLDELLPLQQSILSSAARLVKPGGRLLYATCSMLPCENEKQVDEFLARNELFFQISVQEAWPVVANGYPCPVNGNTLRLNPAEHGTDGFFAAILERKVEG